MNYNYSADEEEKLKHLYLCNQDLEWAQNIIRTIREKTSPDDQDKTLRYFLLQNLVVTYIRPFTVSRGRKLEREDLKNYKGKKTRSYEGDEYTAHRIAKKDNVPDAYNDLQIRLDDFRNQQFAHTDANYFNVQIGNLGTVSDPYWAVSFRRHELEFLDHHLKRVEELVTIVQKRLQAELQAEFDVLKTRAEPEPGAAPSPPG